MGDAIDRAARNYFGDLTLFCGLIACVPFVSVLAIGFGIAFSFTFGLIACVPFVSVLAIGLGIVGLIRARKRRSSPASTSPPRRLSAA
jgi:hypothetical protein